MLAYAANRPVAVDRRPHPNTMLFIIGAHVAVVAAVMSAKMDLPRHIFDPPPKTFWVPPEKDPPPIGQRTRTKINSIDRTTQRVPTPPISHQDESATRPFDPTILGGGGTLVIPDVPHRAITVADSGAQLLTPASELKPPYPPSKLINEEEATLRLKLTIDERGRVIAVDPVGRTDPAFLDAARRHLIAHWRYRPAIEDGQAVTSSSVITLRFQLDG